MTPERHANHVAVIAEALDGVHEPRHQEESPTIFADYVLGPRRIFHTSGKIETGALVHDFHDEAVAVDIAADLDMLGGGLAIPAEDGVGECLGERHREVQRGLPTVVPELCTLAGDHFDHVLYVAHVARYLDFESDAKLLQGW